MLSLKDLVGTITEKVAGEGAEEASPSGDDAQSPVPSAPADEPEPAPAPDVAAVVSAAIAPLQSQIAALEAARAKEEAIARATLSLHARDIVSEAAKEHLGPKIDQVLMLLGKEQDREEAEKRRLEILERVEPLLVALYNLGTDDIKSVVEEMRGLVREAKTAAANAAAHASDTVTAVNALAPYLARILKEEIPAVVRKGVGTDEEF